MFTAEAFPLKSDLKNAIQQLASLYDVPEVSIIGERPFKPTDVQVVTEFLHKLREPKVRHFLKGPQAETVPCYRATFSPSLRRRTKTQVTFEASLDQGKLVCALIAG